MNTEETPAAIYAAFTSAVIGTISLQLARGHGAIPLGSRTLFTAIDKNGYASPAIDNNDPSALSSLTALQVQLTSVGKLTISSQTVAQAGITRLRNNWDHTSKLLDLEPGTDLWLSPHGTIARLVTASPGSPVSSLPNTPSTAEASRRIQWKLAVLEWLQRFGLWVTSAEEELWVEIDVWEPLHAKLAVQTWQPYKESQSAVPLKRILWPARYCFRRTNSTPLGYGPGAFPIISDPVEFAAEWYGLASSIREEADSKFLSVPQEEQITDQVSPSRSDIPEGVESLSRTAQYPDLQTASLVYPTPPDGPVTMGYNNFTPSQTFGEDSDIGLAPLQRDRNQQNDDQSRNPFDRDVAMDFGPSAGLTVGSGLYDTNGEDDLFGEINEKDFGVKGITDADFSFFDDPGFGEMENGTPAGNAQETPPQTTIESNVGKDQIGPGFKLPQDHRADELSAEQGSASQPGFTDSPAKWPPEATLPGSSTAPRTGDSQTISPPLSPVGVKKILFPLLDESHHLGKEDQRQAPYTPVTFDRNMNDWDQKYGSDGKFWFSSAQPTSAANPVDSASDIPKIGMPSRSGKVKALANAPTNPLSDYGTPSNDLKQRFCSESASGSDMSDDTDDTVSEDGTHSAVPTTLKRKRTRSNSEISTALRSGIIPKEVDREVPTADNSTFLGNFLSFFSDWSMIGYFTILQNQALPVLPGREEQAQIAQLLVDQVTQSSLGHNLDGGKGNPNLDDNAFSLRASLGRLSIIGQSENLDMKGFVSLHDNVPSNGFDAAMSRPAAQWQDPKKGLILKASPPHLRLRRGKDYLEALPSVVSFWETFGLEPIHGPKDISAYCIHPPNAAEPADAFLERFGLLYSNCNLGEHLRGGRSLAFERGLALWDTAGLSSYSSIIQSLQSLCEKLGMLAIRASQHQLILNRGRSLEGPINPGQHCGLHNQSI